MVRQSADVLIICALKDEFDQLLDVSEGLVSDGWAKSRATGGRIIAQAVFEGATGAQVSVMATWLSYMGREQTQAALTEIVLSYNIRCLAMTGICAGRRGSVELGDVIFADRLYSYDSGKSVITEGRRTFKADPIQYRPPLPWVQCMQEVGFTQDENWLEGRPALSLEYQENWVLSLLLEGTTPHHHKDFTEECPNWSEVVQRLWKRGWVTEQMALSEKGRAHIERLITVYPSGLPRGNEFSIHIAPMATGASVVEDEDIFDFLSHSNRKVLGLDMEASGLAASSEVLGLPFLVAKGVSDFADTHKDDRYRLFAARAFAEAAIQLLRKADHLLSEQERGAREEQQRQSSVPAAVSPSVIDRELLEVLADLYPDVGEIRSVWELAGGKLHEVDNASNPRNVWQSLLRRSCLGGSVNLSKLVEVVLADYPNNEFLLGRLKALRESQE